MDRVQQIQRERERESSVPPLFSSYWETNRKYFHLKLADELALKCGRKIVLSKDTPLPTAPLQRATVESEDIAAIQRP